MNLTEILQNISLENLINLSDHKDLSKIYKIENSDVQGKDCVGEFVAQSFAKGYNLEIQKVILSNKDINFVTGPENYLEITYSTKVIHELAYKYKVLTKDLVLNTLPTWEGFLKSSIFYAILNNPTTINKLQNFDLTNFLPQWKEKNPDATLTSYKYEFYEDEKPDWADPERLSVVKFDKGYIIITINMPVKEIKTPIEGKEIK